MRRRNVAVLFRLTPKEAQSLDAKVRRSGLSREAYLRQLIKGVVPRDAPPPDYYSMMKELYRIVNSLTRIAGSAHMQNAADAQRYDRDLQEFREAVRKITEAVVLPERKAPPKGEKAKGEGGEKGKGGGR